MIRTLRRAPRLPEPPIPGAAALVVRDLDVTRGGVPVLRAVDLTVDYGEVVALVGPNGAGKSTLLSMISRLLPMSQGQITVDSLDVVTTDSKQLAKRLAILRQDNHLPLRLTVRDLVAFGRFPHSGGRLTAQDKPIIEQAITYLNLQNLADRFLDELSGGQRQRAFVAMVLCQDTDYVLLDEPLNNLDMRHAVDMMKTLRRAADELGKTVVLVLHDINFASCYADQIIAMKNGHLALQGSPEAVITNENLQAIYELDIQVKEIDGQRICVYYR